MRTTDSDGFRRRVKIAVARPAAPAPTMAMSQVRSTSLTGGLRPAALLLVFIRGASPRRAPCSFLSGGLRPAGPPCSFARGDPFAPLRSRGSLAALVRAGDRGSVGLRPAG